MKVLPTADRVLTGDEISVDVRVSSGAAAVSGIDLGEGLKAIGAAVVTLRPARLSGFDLSRNSHRDFAFKIKGSHSGKVFLSARATGSSDGQTVSDSAGAGVTVTPAYQFTLTGFQPGRQDNVGESDTNLFVGSTADYELRGWKPTGGPIDIYADGKLVKSLSAPATADSDRVGEYAINDWVTRGTVHHFKSCEDDLVAKQGDISRELYLVGDPTGAIVYAHNTSGTLKTGELYCSGEYALHPSDFHAKSNGAIVYTYPAKDFSLDTANLILNIDDNERDIHVVGIYVQATSLACVRLDGGRWLTISGGPDSLAGTSIGTRPCPARANPRLSHCSRPWNPVRRSYSNNRYTQDDFV